jgi:hypothetical protein
MIIASLLTFLAIYNGPDRAALCASTSHIDRCSGNMEFLIVCSNVDGRGLNFFDVRDSHLVKLLPNVNKSIQQNLRWVLFLKFIL